MSRSWLATVVCLLLSATACSSKKELTNSSAKSFLKDSIEKDHKEKMLVPQDALSKRLTTDWAFEDYRSMTRGGTDDRSLFRRLLDAGYVDQKSMTLHFPDVAGTYKGEAHPIPGIYAGTHPPVGRAVYQVAISTLPSSLFLSLRYEYHYWSASGQKLMSSSGNATGTLGTDAIAIKYPYGTLKMVKKGTCST